MNTRGDNGRRGFADEAVLIVGAGGFIGRRLARLLAEAGANLQLAVRPGGSPAPSVEEATVVAIDLLDGDQTAAEIARVAPRRIVNLARAGGHRPGGARDETDAAANLMRAAREAGCERLVQLGSGLEYGVTETLIDEETPLRPDTEFGRGKAEATELLLAAPADGPRTAVLRPFMVYGPGEPERRLIPSAVRAAVTREPVPLTSPGLRRDWLFVDDVAAAIALALDGGADGEAVNLASGRDAANEEVVTLVGRAAGRLVPTVAAALRPRPWDVPRQRVSPEKARRLLAWSADVTLEDGVARTVAAMLPGARASSVPAR